MRGGVVLFVPDVSEFEAVVTAARQIDGCTVGGPVDGYHVIRADGPIAFSRRSLGLKPAVWYGLPTGGLIGTIRQFDRDTLIIAPAEVA